MNLKNKFLYKMALEAYQQVLADVKTEEEKHKEELQAERDFAARLENIPHYKIFKWRERQRPSKCTFGYGSPWFEFILLVGIEADDIRVFMAQYLFPEAINSFRCAGSSNLEIIMTFYNYPAKVEKTMEKISKMDHLQKFTWKIYKCDLREYKYPATWPFEGPHPRNFILVITYPSKPPELNGFAKHVFDFPYEENLVLNSEDGRHMVAHDCRRDGTFPRYGKITEARIKSYVNSSDCCDAAKNGFNTFWQEYSGTKVDLFHTESSDDEYDSSEELIF